MKTILVVTTSYFPFMGGGEVGVKRLLKGIKANFGDCELCILTPKFHPSHPAFELEDGVKILRYNSCLLRYPSRLFPDAFNLIIHMFYGLVFMGRYIKEINPDFVLINFLLPSAFPASYHLNRHNIPALLFLAGNDIHNANWLIKRANGYVFKHVKGIITASDFVRKTIQTAYAKNGLNVEVVPYGLDLAEYRCGPKPSRQEIKILCVQRLVKIKGTEYLIKALAQLASEGVSNFVVDIVGDGEEREDLERLAETLGVKTKVSFHGNIENDRVKAFYEDSDLFVLPTLTEPFGIVLLEAMATNNIIIASRCGGIPEIITHERTGILCEPGNVHELSSTLRSVLTNIQQFKPLAANAQRDVAKYDQALIAKRIVDRMLSMA